MMPSRPAPPASQRAANGALKSLEQLKKASRAGQRATTKGARNGVQAWEGSWDFTQSMI